MSVGKTSNEEDALKSVYEAAGIPIDEVCGFMMPDHDLDELCDAILARFAVPSKDLPARD